MKHSNLVVGEKVQAKRTHTDPARPALTLAGGAVFTVEDVFCDPDTGFRLSGETLGAKFGYGVAENFRKYKEPEQEPEQEPQQEVAHQYKVGDKVVVGAEGAGYGRVLPDYAGKVCTVVGVRVHGTINLVMITHPDVRDGSGYTSMLKYLTPHVVAKALKEYDVVKLTRDCVARHGEDIKHGLFEVAIDVEASEDYVTVLTGQGLGGQATLPLEYVHRYKEQDDGQA